MEREGIKCIKEFQKDEVVGICNFKDKIVIATKHGVYMYPNSDTPKPEGQMIGGVPQYEEKESYDCHCGKVDSSGYCNSPRCINNKNKDYPPYTCTHKWYQMGTAMLCSICGQEKEG